MDKNNEKLYLCDPSKNIECKKTDCGHLGTGKCFCTTKKEFMADGYLIEVKTNQDKLAEMVRTEDPMILADMIYDHTVCSTVTTPGLHYCPLASTCTKQGSQSKMECIYDICDWLKEDDNDN